MNELALILVIAKLLFSTSAVNPLFTYKENVPVPAVDVEIAAPPIVLAKLTVVPDTTNMKYCVFSAKPVGSVPPEDTVRITGVLAASAVDKIKLVAVDRVNVCVLSATAPRKLT